MRSLRFLCLVVLLAMWNAGNPGLAAVDTKSDSETSFQHYENGLAYFEQGNFEAAIIELKNALLADSQNISARLLLGRAYLKMGNGAAAESELKLARRDGGDKDLVLLAMGEAYLLQRKFDELLSELRTGNRSQEVEIEVQRLRGEAFLQQQRLIQAAEAFRKAAALRPSDAKLVLGQARVAISQQRLTFAAELAERATTLDPDLVDVWYTKGEIQRQRRDWAGAIAHYDKALTIDPEYLRALIGRAASLIDSDRIAAARRDIEAVREILPDDARATYLYALVLARSDDLPGARAALDQASIRLKQYPQRLLDEHPSAMLLAGTIEFSMQRLGTATKYLEKFIKARPQHAGARRMLATIHMRKGAPNAAFHTLRPVLDWRGNDPTLFAMAGTALMRDGRNSEAARYLEHAVKLAPDRSAFRTQLGLTRLAAGSKDQSVDELTAAFSQDRTATRPGILLGLIHFRNGELEEAFKIATHLIERQPKNPFPYNLAGSALMSMGIGDKARLAFAEALKQDPNYLPAHYNLVQLDHAAGQVDAVRTRLNKIVETHPAEIRAMQQLSRLAEGDGDLPKAIAWLENVRSVDPGNIRPQIRLVELYLQQQEFDRALEVAEAMQQARSDDLLTTEILARVQIAAGESRQAISLLRFMAKRARDNVDHLYRVGGLQRRAGDLENAEGTFRRVLELDPVHEPTHTALVATLLKQGNEAAALESARRLRHAHPSSPVGDILEGDVHVWRRQYGPAIELYTTALSKGQSASLLIRLYKARQAMGDGPRALDLLELWLKGHPQDRNVQMQLAAAYVDADRPDEAIRLYQQLSLTVPDNAAVLNNLAGLYQQKGDRRALPLARRALAMAPRQPAVLDTVGWIMVQQGDAKGGLSYLRQAYDRASSHPEIRFHLAAALARLGKTSEAKKHLQGVLASTNDQTIRKAVIDQAQTLLKSLPK